MDLLSELGIGGILAILILQQVFAFLKARKNNNHNPGHHNSKVAKQIADLHEWHNKTDEDGVRIWYIRRSLEESIRKLTDAVAQQNATLLDMTRELQALRESTDRLRRHRRPDTE